MITIIIPAWVVYTVITLVVLYLITAVVILRKIWTRWDG